MCVTPGPAQLHLLDLSTTETAPLREFSMNEHHVNSMVGIVWSNTQEKAMSEQSNPQPQPSQLYPVTRKPSGPVVQ